MEPTKRKGVSACACALIGGDVGWVRGKGHWVLHGHFGAQLGQLCLFVVFLGCRLCGCLARHYRSHQYDSDKVVGRERLNLRSDFPASGNRSNWVLTGTGPVLSIRSSIASCSSPSNSCSSSSSSGCSPNGTWVIIWPISSLSWCCSRSWSLRLSQ